MSNLSLPVLQENGLSQYIESVNKFPLLEDKEEYNLAVNYKENEDLAAAHKLVTSHLRLVVKIAMGYRGYGLPVTDIISEGNIGLMQAVKKFEPEKGFRLSTYAMWWIKASINEYILKSWSIVKVGTSAAQKKLFFNLKRLKGKIMGADASSAMTDAVAAKIAGDLEVSSKEVVEMDNLMSGGSKSLNVAAYDEGESEQIDFLEDKSANQEVEFANQEELDFNKEILYKAIENLNEREQDIIKKRKLRDNPLTLEDLSSVYKVSRERIRQIESKALEKIQKFVLAEYKKLGASAIA